ncbi:MAG: hypothetical protein JKY96_08940 [Phycisphaerales bacterium]|nr:hypothetical protein [Phycisphaerales bacterium]
MRRYLGGDSRIPADFIGQIYRTHNHIDIYAMLGFTLPDPNNQLRYIQTHQLINELAQRFKLIEDATISTIVMRDMVEPTEMHA